MAGLWDQKNSSRGRGAAGLVKIEFRVRFLFFFFFFLSKLPPSMQVLEATIYRQNVARFPNLVPQLLLFCKFDFS